MEALVEAADRGGRAADGGVARRRAALRELEDAEGSLASLRGLAEKAARAERVAAVGLVSFALPGKAAGPEGTAPAGGGGGDVGPAAKKIDPYGYVEGHPSFYIPPPISLYAAAASSDAPPAPATSGARRDVAGPRREELDMDRRAVRRLVFAVVRAKRENMLCESLCVVWGLRGEGLKLCGGGGVKDVSGGESVRGERPGSEI